MDIEYKTILTIIVFGLIFLYILFNINKMDIDIEDLKFKHKIRDHTLNNINQDIKSLSEKIEILEQELKEK